MKVTKTFQKMRTLLVFCLILSLWGCNGGRTATMVDPLTKERKIISIEETDIDFKDIAISKLDKYQQTTYIKDLFTIEKPCPIEAGYVECFIDNSGGMNGYLNRQVKDLNKDRGIGYLIDQFQMHEFENLTFRSFDDSEKDNGMREYSISEFNVLKTNEFYKNDQTPMTRNIEYIMDKIDKSREIDGAFIITDGIEDTGVDVTTPYMKVIADWVKEGNQFQLITVPIVFNGIRYYAPPPGTTIKMVNSFKNDFTKQSTQQYIYVLAFSNTTFADKTLGEYLIPRVERAFPKYDIEYLDFSRNYLTCDLKTVMNDKIGATYQNQENEDELNLDLEYFGKDLRKNFFEYSFYNKRKPSVEIYDKDDELINIPLDLEKISLGKIEGTITIPNLLNIDDIKLQAKYSVLVLGQDPDDKMLSELIPLYDNEGQNTIINLSFCKNINDTESLQKDGFVTYSIFIDNILIKKPDVQKGSHVVVKLSLLLPKHISYGQNIINVPISIKGRTVFINVRDKGNSRTFRGLDEKNIFNGVNNYYNYLSNISILDQYILIHF